MADEQTIEQWLDAEERRAQRAPAVFASVLDMHESLHSSLSTATTKLSNMAAATFLPEAAAARAAAEGLPTAGSWFSRDVKHCSACGKGSTKANRDRCKGCGASGEWVAVGSVGARLVKKRLQNEALLKAAAAGNTETMKQLLAAGVDGDALDQTTSITAAHLAAGYGHTKALKILVDAGVNIEARAHGMTPVHFAALGPQAISCYMSGEQGRPAMQCVQVEVMEVLVKSGADLEARCDESYTPAHMAALYGTDGVLEVLIKAKVNVEVTTRNESWPFPHHTPLHMAAFRGNAAAVKLLINAQANIESLTKTAATPAHLAAKNGHADALEMLINAKAHLAARDKDGLTCLGRAQKYERRTVTSMLIEHEKSQEATEARRQRAL